MREGWAPLLAFLDVDDPALAAEAFPHENDIESLRAVRAAMDVVAIGLPLWIGLALAFWGLVFRRAFRRCFGTKAKGD